MADSASPETLALLAANDVCELQLMMRPAQRPDQISILDALGTIKKPRTDRLHGVLRWWRAVIWRFR